MLEVYSKGKKIGEVVINTNLNIAGVMYALGYDINIQEDLKKAYENGLGCVYVSDENGEYLFDECAIELKSRKLMYMLAMYSDDMGTGHTYMFHTKEAAIEAAESGKYPVCAVWDYCYIASIMAVWDSEECDYVQPDGYMDNCDIIEIVKEYC